MQQPDAPDAPDASQIPTSNDICQRTTPINTTHNDQAMSPEKHRQSDVMANSVEDVAQSSMPTETSKSNHDLSKDAIEHSAVHPDASNSNHDLSNDAIETLSDAQTLTQDTTSAIPFHNDTASSDIATVPLKMNTLRRIPPELRQRIFYMSSVSSDTLAALIGDQVIYQDALKIYWETTRCTIPQEFGRNWQFSKDCSLSQKSLNSIKKVNLTHTTYWEFHLRIGESVPSPLNDEIWCGWDCQTPPMNELVKLNITDLHLRFETSVEVIPSDTVEYGKHPVYSNQILGSVMDCMAAFSGTSPGLDTLSCEIPRHRWPGYVDGYSDAIETLNAAFGLPAKLRSVDSGRCPVVFVWAAPEGKQLEWHDHEETNVRTGNIGRPYMSGYLKTSPYFRKDTSELTAQEHDAAKDRDIEEQDD